MEGAAWLELLGKELLVGGRKLDFTGSRLFWSKTMGNVTLHVFLTWFHHYLNIWILLSRNWGATKSDFELPIEVILSSCPMFHCFIDKALQSQKYNCADISSISSENQPKHIWMTFSGLSLDSWFQAIFGIFVSNGLTWAGIVLKLSTSIVTLKRRFHKQA